jgi:hypothetical protein
MATSIAAPHWILVNTVGGHLCDESASHDAHLAAIGRDALPVGYRAWFCDAHGFSWSSHDCGYLASTLIGILSWASEPAVVSLVACFTVAPL